MPVRTTDRVPGYRDLPLSRRLRVIGLWAIGAALAEMPAVATRLAALAPPMLKKLAGPLRVGGTGRAWIDPETRLDPLQPSDGKPAASIVIPTRGSEHLRLCLEAIAAHTETPHEVVVVRDDGEPARGFAASVNLGIQRARTDTIVILNDDTVVTPGWLELLLGALEDDVGLVGPASNDTGDVASVPASYATIPELLDHAARACGAPRDVDKLSLFCAALRRSTLEAVGGLDEGYGAGMFEDDDLCMALRARGLRVVLVPSAFVHHAAGGTLRKLDRFEYLARFEVNRARFERRWGISWRPR